MGEGEEGPYPLVHPYLDDPSCLGKDASFSFLCKMSKVSISIHFTSTDHTSISQAAVPHRCESVHGSVFRPTPPMHRWAEPFHHPPAVHAASHHPPPSTSAFKPTAPGERNRQVQVLSRMTVLTQLWSMMKLGSKELYD